MKKLQDTKIGQLLKEKAPQVFEVAKNLLPDKGLLGVVKNLVSQSDLSQEDKEQIHKQLVEFYELEVKDRDSARDREVKMAEAGANGEQKMKYILKHQLCYQQLITKKFGQD